MLRADVQDNIGPIDQRKIAAFARRKPWVQIPLGPLSPQAFYGIRGDSWHPQMRPIVSEKFSVDSGTDGLFIGLLQRIPRDDDALHSRNLSRRVLLEITHVAGTDVEVDNRGLLVQIDNRFP